MGKKDKKQKKGKRRNLEMPTSLEQEDIETALEQYAKAIPVSLKVQSEVSSEELKRRLKLLGLPKAKKLVGRSFQFYCQAGLLVGKIIGVQLDNNGVLQLEINNSRIGTKKITGKLIYMDYGEGKHRYKEWVIEVFASKKLIKQYRALAESHQAHWGSYIASVLLDPGIFKLL